MKWKDGLTWIQRQAISRKEYQMQRKLSRISFKSRQTNWLLSAELATFQQINNNRDGFSDDSERLWKTLLPAKFSLWDFCSKSLPEPDHFFFGLASDIGGG